MGRYKYAVFDLDGTLLDSMHMWGNVGIDFLIEIGVVPPEGLRETLKPLGLRAAARYFVDELGVTMKAEEIVDRINEMVGRNYRSHIGMKQGVREFLDDLMLRGIKMCVATATDYPHVEAALKRLDIWDYFEFVVTCQEVNAGKESPKIYLESAKRLNASVDEVVIFEDALHAACTAKTAGFYVVGVYDASAEQDMDGLKEVCDEYVFSFDDVECFR